MLQQFRLSGFVESHKGLVIGTFTDCEGDEDERDYDLGYEALRYMEIIEILNYQNLLYAMYQQVMEHAASNTTIIGATINFRYISNTIIIHPYSRIDGLFLDRINNKQY